MIFYYIQLKLKKIVKYFSIKKVIKYKFYQGIGTYGLDKNLIYSYRLDDSLSIGSYCSIARDVVFILSGEHYLTRVSTFPFKDIGSNKKIHDDYDDTLSKGPIIIGNDVWIGARATICSGVNIGNGAVIGAGSVVVNDVPSFAIVAGNPAKVIRFRFPESQICLLNKIKWWEWPEDVVKSRIEEFYTDVESFINKHEK